MSEQEKIRKLEERIAKLERGGSHRYGQRGIPYEYKSERTFKGWPLVHIVQGGGAGEKPKHVAKGVIAIGDVAVGLVAIGGITLGGVSPGGLSLGILSLGGMAVGGLCFGGVSVGLIAIGGLAVGYLAVGGLAVGYYAIGGDAIGQYIMSSRRQDPEVIEFLKSTFGPFWQSVLDIVKPGGR